jgi:hypothetical protein
LKITAFYAHHSFPITKAGKEEPDESQEPEISNVVTDEDGAEVNKSYVMPDEEDDKEGEGACAASGAASNTDGEAAAAATAAPDAAAAAAEATQA